MINSNLAYDLSDEFGRSPTPPPIDRPWLRFYTKLFSFAVLFLIFMGALVTSHDAGLAVPDWPTTFGENMFTFHYSKWVGGIFFEHSHRLVASIIGLMTVILSVWLWRVEKRGWIKWLGVCALVAVILQGVLGGLTVLYLLPDALSVAHGVLGQTFLVLTLVLAYSQSKEFSTARQERLSPELFRLALGSTLLVYLQLILGAAMRHSGAGLAIPDFPEMGGSYSLIFDEQRLAAINQLRESWHLSAVSLSQVYIHLAHRIVGVLVALGAIYCGIKFVVNGGFLRVHGAMVLLLVALQFTLGVITVLSHRAPILTSLHVLGGALLLGVLALLVMRSLNRIPSKSEF